MVCRSGRSRSCWLLCELFLLYTYPQVSFPDEAWGFLLSLFVFPQVSVCFAKNIDKNTQLTYNITKRGLLARYVIFPFVFV